MVDPVLIIGKGSIGVRHAQVVSDLGRPVRFVSRRAEPGTFRSIRHALDGEAFSCAVVATETARHGDDLAELAACGYAGTVLVEKPVLAFASDLDKPLPAGRVFAGYNMRFVPVVQALREALRQDGSRIACARLHAGQSLSRWRPGRARESSYSAYRAAGGGALRDLSHELDLALWLFGPAAALTARGGRIGEETIDSDDCWSILLECRSCSQVVVTLNMLDHPAGRSISVSTARTTYRADLIGGTLHIGEAATEYPMERNLSYRRMWEALLGGDESGRGQLCGWKEGLSVFSVIRACEEAAECAQWIRLN